MEGTRGEASQERTEEALTDEPEDGLPCEVEIHDPLAEDLQRLVETWGLATVLHGLKVEATLRAEQEKDEDERGMLFLVAAHLDAAWVDAEGGER